MRALARLTPSKLLLLTTRPEVIGGLVPAPAAALKDMEEPVLVSGTMLIRLPSPSCLTAVMWRGSAAVLLDDTHGHAEPLLIPWPWATCALRLLPRLLVVSQKVAADVRW